MTETADELLLSPTKLSLQFKTRTGVIKELTFSPEETMGEGLVKFFRFILSEGNEQGSAVPRVLEGEMWPSSTGALLPSSMTTEHIMRCRGNLKRQLSEGCFSVSDKQFKEKWIAKFGQILEARGVKAAA